LAGHGANIAIRLISNLVLASLLAPAMLGVVALAQTVLNGLYMFTDFGLRPYLVQSPAGSDERVINTLWTLQLSRGIMISLGTAGFALALWALQSQQIVGAASAYANTQLPGVMLLLALVPAIGGFESTRTSEAQRHLQMGAVTRLAIYAQVFCTLVMLVVAWLTRSIWALPLGGLCGILATTVLSHIMLPGTPNRLAWHADILPALKRFSAWIMFGSIVGFFAGNLDRLILGATASAAALGVYSVAFTSVAVVSDGMGRLLSDLALPSFSEIQRERPQDLRRAHYRFRRTLDIFSFLVIGGLIAAGPSAVHFLYDARYADAGWMVTILAWSLLSLRYRATAIAVLATGDSRINFLHSLTAACTMTVGASCGLALGGTQGFVIGVALAPVAASVTPIWVAARQGLLDVVEEVKLVPLIGVGYVAGLAAARVIDMLPRLHH
jgi:O-antigen/teichoic acid export membrane protein